MKKLLLTAAVVLSGFAFAGTAYAAPCGSVTTSSFDSVITSLNDNLPSGSRSERRYKRNLIRATQNNINSSCSTAESLENSMGGVASGSLTGFMGNFTNQLAQITSVLTQVKSIVSMQNVTQAQVNQANNLIAQAKSMSDQLKQQARQMAKQLAQSLEVNLN